MKDQDKKTLYILGAIIILCIVIWLGILSLISTVAKAESKHRQEDYNTCVLESNKKYDKSIKTEGTPMFISGKDVTGLSNEQWKAIDDQRIKDIANCPKE